MKNLQKTLNTAQGIVTLATRQNCNLQIAIDVLKEITHHQILFAEIVGIDEIEMVGVTPEIRTQFSKMIDVMEKSIIHEHELSQIVTDKLYGNKELVNELARIERSLDKNEIPE